MTDPYQHRNSSIFRERRIQSGNLFTPFPNNPIIVSRCQSINFWNVYSGAHLGKRNIPKRFEYNNRFLQSRNCQLDRERAAFGDIMGSIFVYNLINTNSEKTQHLQPFNDIVRSLDSNYSSFHSRERNPLLLACSHDGGIVLYDALSWKKRIHFYIENEPINDIKFISAGSSKFCCASNKIRLYDLKKQREFLKFNYHTETLDFSHTTTPETTLNSSLLFTVDHEYSGKKCVRIFNANKHEKLLKLEFPCTVKSICALPNLYKILVGDEQGNLYCTDYRKNQNKPVWYIKKAHTKKINSIVKKVDQFDNRFCTSSNDKFIKTFTFKGKELVKMKESDFCYGIFLFDNPNFKPTIKPLRIAQEIKLDLDSIEHTPKSPKTSDGTKRGTYGTPRSSTNSPFGGYGSLDSQSKKINFQRYAPHGIVNNMLEDNFSVSIGKTPPSTPVDIQKRLRGKPKYHSARPKATPSQLFLKSFDSHENIQKFRTTMESKIEQELIEKSTGVIDFPTFKKTKLLIELKSCKEELYNLRRKTLSKIGAFFNDLKILDNFVRNMDEISDMQFSFPMIDFLKSELRGDTIRITKRLLDHIYKKMRDHNFGFNKKIGEELSGLQTIEKEKINIAYFRFLTSFGGNKKHIFIGSVRLNKPEGFGFLIQKNSLFNSNTDQLRRVVFKSTGNGKKKQKKRKFRKRLDSAKLLPPYVKMYDGEWSDGKRHGRGVEYNEKGQREYEGQWRWNKRHGRGVEYEHITGKQTEGIWDDGEIKEIIRMYKFDIIDFSTMKDQIVEENELNRGGNGTIYRIKIRNRLYAAKILRQFNARTTSKQTYILMKRKIERSLGICATLNHVNILKTSAMVTGERIGYIMELADKSVAELIRSSHGQIKMREKLRILYQTCRAMQYLHSQRVMNRDLKWANVLIDSKGEIKLIDFDSVKEDDGLFRFSVEHTSSGLGTPTHIAPEVFSKKYGLKVDVYSFGIMIYSLLFDMANPYFSTYRCPCGCLIKDITSYAFPTHVRRCNLRPEISGEMVQKKVPKDCLFLVELMKLCWQKSPKKRPSFSQILEVLDDHISNTRKKSYFIVDVEIKGLEKLKEPILVMNLNLLNLLRILDNKFDPSKVVKLTFLDCMLDANVLGQLRTVGKDGLSEEDSLFVKVFLDRILKKEAREGRKQTIRCVMDPPPKYEEFQTKDFLKDEIKLRDDIIRKQEVKLSAFRRVKIQLEQSREMIRTQARRIENLREENLQTKKKVRDLTLRIISLNVNKSVLPNLRKSVAENKGGPP